MSDPRKRQQLSKEWLEQAIRSMPAPEPTFPASMLVRLREWAMRRTKRSVQS